MPLFGNKFKLFKSHPPPGLVSKHLTRSSLKLRSQQNFNSVPPYPKPKTTSTEATGLEIVDILDDISPLREFLQQQQNVSSSTVSRLDVVRLQELLDTQLQQRQAKETGICPIRREIYSKCFDELIQQVAIDCDERGLLLSRVKHEIEISLCAYKTLYESGVASGMRKFLQAGNGKADMEKRISDLENEIHDLRKELDQEKARSDATEISSIDKQKVENERLTEELEFLKTSNEQLEFQLQEINKLKKLQDN
nr:PREDICTED: axonemal dynein light intermediate polypeptide 1-like [Paralichthys olivaceus]